jgi:hypothetical protein
MRKRIGQRGRIVAIGETASWEVETQKIVSMPGIPRNDSELDVDNGNLAIRTIRKPGLKSGDQVTPGQR